tara:strand:- start:2214 stop:2408 length:195 start_codon:yes stop_codon:yes gene_type:complete
MSRVKQWAENTAEEKVDNIIAKLTSGDITRSDARTQIMSVDNIAMLGIDENTVDEVIYEASSNA